MNMPGKKAQLMKQLGMKLPFEEKLGLDFGSTVSLDKKNRWKTIPEVTYKSPTYASRFEVILIVI